MIINSFNPFSAKPIFGRKKKKSFFRKFYSYHSFYDREKKFLSSFFSQLIELFYKTMKTIENPAKHELFLPKH